MSRWWFRLAVVFVTIVLIYLAYRYRIENLLRLERLRLRIASDLHDDVGSALTKIAVHSEIIQNANDLKKVRLSSQLIGNLSREIIRTFSDIVWSIDTRHDTYGELTARMKSFALDVLSPKDIAVEFVTDGLVASNKVSVELRQNLYLIFKEAINNIAKHSSATQVLIELKKTDHTLSLRIKDNGQGIPEEHLSQGHGIRNMRMRAEVNKGLLRFENNNGWMVELKIPMRV
jgi:signal transduction histidine kinase